MILKELFREHFDTFRLTRNARIRDAAVLMQREKIGAVVIVEDEKVIGIVTDRDIGLCVSLGAATPDSHLEEVMSKSVETVNQSMNLLEVTRFFRTARVQRLPVVDDDDRLVGIVSTDDVLGLLARELFDTCSALEPKIGHMV